MGRKGLLMKTTLIKDINIVDGTGNETYVGSILLKGKEIAQVGKEAIDTHCDVKIDGKGLYICPGFIDMHSHSSLAYIDKPSIDAKIYQGVTSEVIGVDGLSVYPVQKRHVASWGKYLSGLEGDLPAEWSWGSLNDWIRSLGLTGTNPIPLVGHGTIRKYVMGMEERKASPKEIADMCSCLAECFEQGAWGLSTGLIYSPCCYADIEELIALAKVVFRFDGIFAIHMRYEGEKIMDSIEEVGRIGRESQCKVHISHLKLLGKQVWGQAKAVINKINDLREEGIKLTADQYPYTACSTMMSSLLPPWVHAVGPNDIKKMLIVPDTLKKIKQDMETGLENWESASASMGWDNTIVASVITGNNKRVEGKNITEIAESMGETPFETVIRLLLEEDFAVGMIQFGMMENDVEQIMQAPWVCFCTDGLLGGKPHPRAYGTYARILAEYVRKQGVLDLETAVQKSTSLVADILGLKNRGKIESGYAADLCIFDLKNLDEKASFENPRVHPSGIIHVIVNGTPIIWENRASGKLAGQALLRQ